MNPQILRLSSFPAAAAAGGHVGFGRATFLDAGTARGGGTGDAAVPKAGEAGNGGADGGGWWTESGQFSCFFSYMEVSKNRGTPKSSICRLDFPS